MIETDHKNVFCHWSIMVGPRPFLVKSLKGTGTESVSRTIKILKQLFIEFHSLFVCKVSVSSNW